MCDLAGLVAVDTLQWDPYENESQHSETFPILDEEPEVTLELGDQYENEKILL